MDQGQYLSVRLVIYIESCPIKELRSPKYFSLYLVNSDSNFGITITINVLLSQKLVVSKAVISLLWPWFCRRSNFITIS